jgi:hypothetical protein
MVLLVLLLDPFVSGWYAVDNFSFTPVSLCSACQNCEVNSLSWSERMFKGKPFSQYHLVKKIWVSSSAVRDVIQGVI